MCQVHKSLTPCYCRDCGEFICAACTDTHAHWDAFTDHKSVSLNEFEKKVKNLEKVTLYCSLHQGKELELYCETCEELICLLCSVKKHRDHQYDLVADMYEQKKAEITTSLEPVERQLETIINEQMNTEPQVVEANRKAVETKIHKKINELQTQLVSCLAFIRDNLRTGTSVEVMRMKTGIIREIITSIKLDELSSVDLKFSATFELAQNCRQVGQKPSIKVSAQRSYATGKGLKVAVQGKKATTVVHLCDEQGRVYPKPIKSLTCELSSNTRVVKGSVKKINDGQYEISYQPTSRGRHQLHIKMEGEHIKGSPFSVNILLYLPVQELGTPARTITGVNGPCGVAIHQRGEVVISDFLGNCVSIFTLTAEKIRSFGSGGSGQGTIQ